MLAHHKHMHKQVELTQAELQLMESQIRSNAQVSWYGNGDFVPWAAYEFQDYGFLRKYRLLELYVSRCGLEFACLPRGGSSGLFAFDGKELLYLNKPQAEANLKRVLKAENPPLELANPLFLSSFLCNTIASPGGNASIDVLQSPDELINPQCTLIEDQYEKCQDNVKPPEIAGNSKIGWRLRFWGLHGWMHQKNAVSFYECTITAEFEVDIKDHPLTNKLYSKLSSIRI